MMLSTGGNASLERKRWKLSCYGTLSENDLEKNATSMYFVFSNYIVEGENSLVSCGAGNVV